MVPYINSGINTKTNEDVAIKMVNLLNVRNQQKRNIPNWPMNPKYTNTSKAVQAYQMSIIITKLEIIISW
jgi:hypothetical protein